MQVIFEDEVKRSNGRRTGAVGFVVCTERIGRYIEGEHDGGNGGRGGGI